MSLANHILVGAGVGVVIWWILFRKPAGSGQVQMGVLPGGGYGNLGVPVPGSDLAQEAADLQNSFMTGSYY